MSYFVSEVQTQHYVKHDYKWKTQWEESSQYPLVSKEKSSTGASAGSVMGLLLDKRQEENWPTEDEIGWMVSLTQWVWVWASSRNWWWTGKHVMLQFIGSQRVGHNWVTELSWTYWLSQPLKILNHHPIMSLCCAPKAKLSSRK